MKLTRFFLLIAAAFILLCPTGCKKNKNGNFVLQIKGMYGNQPLVMDSFYTDPSGRVLTFQSFQFYLSHIVLVETNGSVDTLSAVSLFGFPSADNPYNNLSVSLNNIKGDFKAISFGCGVDSIQNLTIPNNVLPPNPLSYYYGMYWPMLDYQFIQLNGKWDTAELALMRNSLYYHVGTNPLYYSTTLNQSFSVCCDNTTTITLTLDVRKMFYGNSNTLNISNQGQASTQMSYPPNGSDIPATAPAFCQNFSQAFSISQ